jgi:hypothetical protein
VSYEIKPEVIEEKKQASTPVHKQPEEVKVPQQK